MRSGYEQLEPAELLDRVRGHDQSAWNELVSRYAGLVWRIAMSHRLDPADAADVSQHTWLALAGNLARIRDSSRLPGWLASTARRESLRLIRSRTREVHADSFLGTVRETAIELCPEDHLLSSARDRLLWRAFAALPERCQRILGILAFAPGISYARVADALGMKLGSVGPSRSRCLHTLRRNLADLGLTEGAAG
jgi:RNA polymerase sigma factor (sigma-70 family)